MLAVFGLLGLLLTIGILGLLATRVLGSVDPAAGEVAVPGASEQEVASSVACDADRAAVELALRTYTLQVGSPPPDEAAMAEAGLLPDPVDTFEYRPGEPDPVVGVGSCAGR